MAQVYETDSWSLRSVEGSIQRNDHRRLIRILTVAFDLVLIWSSGLLGLILQSPRDFFPGWHNPSLAADREVIMARIGLMLLYSALITLFAHMQDLYRDDWLSSVKAETWAVAKAVGQGTVLFMGFTYLLRLSHISPLVIIFVAVVSMTLLVLWRRLNRYHLQETFPNGWNCRNVLLVGTSAMTEIVRGELQKNRALGYVIKGDLVCNLSHAGVASSLNTSGSLAELRRLIRTHFVDEVLICHHDRNLVKAVTGEARKCGAAVRVVPDLYDGLALGAPVEYLGRFPTIALHRQQAHAPSLALKRVVDAMSSGIALLLLLPILTALAIVILLDTPGPVIYVSRRVGRKGKHFNFYKFRTMVADADRQKEQLRARNERDGILFKIADDPRITRSGRVLRKYSLDELPQLWNVFKGDMSLVGPRPPLADEVRQYELEQLRRLDVMPGITGLWQVEARGNPSFESYISLDMQYVEQWSLLLDLKILVKTFRVVLFGTGC
jgi:exopolysaccharide biosynthesis polyprenyl glycosylphosphotransferase